MYRTLIKFEFKSNIRSKAFVGISILFFFIVLFAGLQGYKFQEIRAEKLDLSVHSAQLKIQQAKDSILKLERGETLNMRPWLYPDLPMVIGDFYQEGAHMPPKSSAFLAIGFSDLFAHSIFPKVTGKDILTGFEEFSNPLTVMFGFFDLAFVIIFLLPIIIIAFTFNLISKERDEGRIYLLAAQKLPVNQFFLIKIGFYFLWILGMTLLPSAIVFILSGTFLSISFLQFSGLVLLYSSFWFGLVYLVNCMGRNSSTNAFMLSGFWLLFVILIPALINKVSSWTYPLPSRNIFITEMRQAQHETTIEQDKILESFLRDHPELAALSNTNPKDNFWYSYMAAHHKIDQKLQPLQDDFQNTLQLRQSNINQLQFLSPAAIVYSAMLKLAGTSEMDYQAFRDQVMTFSKIWRRYFMKLTFEEKKFTIQRFEELPQFTFECPNHQIFKAESLWLLFLTLLFVTISHHTKIKL